MSEARDGAGTEPGAERLVDLVRGASDRDAAGVVQRIENALDEFSSGAPAEDDRTLLVLKRVDASAA